jgi:hypothetical protein
MRLIKARVQNYRSIIDTGEFEIEDLKTIMVGPNEAGKTVILKALQQLNKPDDVSGFDVLRDYPRSKLDDINTGKVDPKTVKVATGWFKLDDKEKEMVPTGFRNCIYRFSRYLNNDGYYSLENIPEKLTYKSIKSDLMRMGLHFDKLFLEENPEGQATRPSIVLNNLTIKWITTGWTEESAIEKGQGDVLKTWLDKNFQYLEESNSKEEDRYNKLLEQVQSYKPFETVSGILSARMPVFILFNNYFRVKPSIHLEHLAHRLESKVIDDEYYDYGNLCLLKLLGFTPRELSDLGKAQSPRMGDAKALQDYKDMLDTRTYKLNAASIKLSKEIKSVWNPDPHRPEAERLRVSADGQYLKVVVEDDLGVEVELDQRSEGFQWLVSFFVVFFAESSDKHENAILLLDEPGMSLHV